nr:transposase [Natrinema soli]
MLTDGSERAGRTAEWWLVFTESREATVHRIDVLDCLDSGVIVQRYDSEQGSHAMLFLYVLSTKGDGTAVFATNLSVGADEAETFCRRYRRRWQIENEYKSIKNDFLAKTSSKDYRVRLFYFVFAVLLHNIWRLTDFLLKAGVDGEMDYAPVITAGECVELVCSALLPSD